MPVNQHLSAIFPGGYTVYRALVNHSVCAHSHPPATVKHAVAQATGSLAGLRKSPIQRSAASAPLVEALEVGGSLRRREALNSAADFTTRAGRPDRSSDPMLDVGLGVPADQFIDDHLIDRVASRPCSARAASRVRRAVAAPPGGSKIASGKAEVLFTFQPTPFAVDGATSDPSGRRLRRLS